MPDTYLCRNVHLVPTGIQCNIYTHVDSPNFHRDVLHKWRESNNNVYKIGNWSHTYFPTDMEW